MIRRIIESVKWRFNKIFWKKSQERHQLVGPSYLWKMKRDFQINFLQSHGLEKSKKLLDIGCGTLRGGIPLIKFLDTGNYYGIDVRAEVLEEGRSELKKHKLEHKNPNLQSFSEFRELNIPISFDIIFAFSVLFHLEDHITKSCFEFVGKHIKEDGVFYANVNLGERENGSWQGFPVVWRSLDFYEELAKNNGLQVKTVGKLLDLGHHSGDKAQDDQIMLAFTKG